MNNNHPPFRVGQRVVCMKKDGWRCTKELGVAGPEYLEQCEVESVFFSLFCWYLTLKGYGHNLYVRRIDFNAIYFAPIDPLYADITKELASKEVTEEVPDIKIKELVN